MIIKYSLSGGIFLSKISKLDYSIKNVRKIYKKVR